MFLKLHNFSRLFLSYPGRFRHACGILIAMLCLGLSTNLHAIPGSPLKINEVMASNTSTLADEHGEFDDWVELLCCGSNPVNLKGMYVTDRKDEPKKYKIQADTLLYPGSYLILWADESPEEGNFHMNFKLSSSGESLYLFGSDGTTLLDSMTFGKQRSDISYGLLSDNVVRAYIVTPTPGKRNPDTGCYGITDEPVPDIKAGFIDEPVTITLSSGNGTKIYYTTNCSTPDKNSTVYTGPISVSKSKVIRAIAYRDGYLPSRVATQSYFMGCKSTLDVVSLVTDSLNLYHASMGIFTVPKNNQEKPVHVEYFAGKSKLRFSVDAGLKIHAPEISQPFSLRLCARSEYGEDEFDYPFFGSKSYSGYNSILLTNDGNDGLTAQPTGGTQFRDPVMQTLFRKISPEHNFNSANKPVTLYINGDYWGIYIMRERIDEAYISQNFDYSGSMDFLEYEFGYTSNRHTLEGSWKLYDSIQNFAIKKDLDIDANYDSVSHTVNIKNFTDYWIYEIFVGNFDWLANNIKIWRPAKPGGQFNWLLWDLDHGMGLPYQTYGYVTWNTLDWATGTAQGRPGSGANTKLIRGLLNRVEYKNYFINRFADLLNTYLLPERTGMMIDSAFMELYPEIEDHYARWGRSPLNEWISAVDVMHEYAELRPDYVRQYILLKFNLSGMYSLKLDVSPSSSGAVEVNTLREQELTYPWEGTYFKGVPVNIKAVPAPGYRFAGWKDSDNTNSELSFTAGGDTSLTALFEPVQTDPARVVINEINYKSPDDSDPGDWVEIRNTTGIPVNLSGWKLKNTTGTAYVFPSGSLVNADDFLLVCSNLDRFHAVHPGIKGTLGNLPFTLSGKGDVILLLDGAGNLIDSVAYEDHKPWTKLADGNGFTLELKNPYSDNSLQKNWSSSIQLHGTPGAENTTQRTPAWGLFINEFQTHDNTNFQDDNGEYDDWIEIYNSRNYPIDLGGLFVTDNLSNRIKHQIPMNDPEATTLQPKSYMILWADDQIWQGPRHLSFKLDAREESIGLAQNTGFELVWIDSLNYALNDTNVSTSRNIDGINEWCFKDPTPGYKNGIVTDIPDIARSTTENSFTLYPNPSDGKFYIQSKGCDKTCNFEIWNSWGQMVAANTITNPVSPYFVDLGDQPGGMYIIRIWQQNKQAVAVMKLIIR
jgi:uncharacterized repeat protein (TIGR02543 family)